MISAEKELYLGILTQAIQDYEEFLERSNPESLYKMNSLYKSSPACRNTNEDLWHPRDFIGVLEFFSSVDIVNLLFYLDINTEYYFDSLKKYLIKKYGGIIQTCLSFSFNVEGDGNMSSSLIHKECINIFNELTKSSNIIWKESGISYREILDTVLESINDDQKKALNLWPLSDLTHVETWEGSGDNNKNRYYLGVFSREVTKKKESNKGPNTYKKYLLFMIGEDGQMYELRKAGKLLTTIYSLFGKKTENTDEDNTDLNMLNFLRSIQSQNEKAENNE